MPFAGYKDFDDCVRKNADKKDPKAYCATIMRETEGKPPKKKHRLVGHWTPRAAGK